MANTDISTTRDNREPANSIGIFASLDGKLPYTYMVHDIEIFLLMQSDNFWVSLERTVKPSVLSQRCFPPTVGALLASDTSFVVKNKIPQERTKS